MVSNYYQWFLFQEVSRSIFPCLFSTEEGQFYGADDDEADIELTESGRNVLQQLDAMLAEGAGTPSLVPQNGVTTNGHSAGLYINFPKISDVGVVSNLFSFFLHIPISVLSSACKPIYHVSFCLVPNPTFLPYAHLCFLISFTPIFIPCCNGKNFFLNN